MTSRLNLGRTIWLTGLPASGKSTIAALLFRLVENHGWACRLIDGDDVRETLNRDLGYSREDRAENVRRLGEMAILCAQQGSLAIVAAISPYLADRGAVRDRHQALDIPFAEVYIATPLSVCEGRDPKGLYAQARDGKVHGVTGVDDPYEPPVGAEFILPADRWPADVCASHLFRWLISHS